MKALNTYTLKIQSAVLVGIMFASSDVQAGNNFSDIARNINNSIEELPGLVTGVSYMMGLLLGTLGIMKLKDHVENPTQTPLKDGAVRLAAGGALFGLPIVFESMLNTVGTTSAGVEPAQLNRVMFNVN